VRNESNATDGKNKATQRDINATRLLYKSPDVSEREMRGRRAGILERRGAGRQSRRREEEKQSRVPAAPKKKKKAIRH
jgi:hypothetical protein